MRPLCARNADSGVRCVSAELHHPRANGESGDRVTLQTNRQDTVRPPPVLVPNHLSGRWGGPWGEGAPQAAGGGNMVPSYDHQRQPATPTAMKSWPSSPSSECGRANLDADGESSHPSRPTQSLPGGGVNCPHLDGLLVPTLGPRTGPHSVAAPNSLQEAKAGCSHRIAMGLLVSSGPQPCPHIIATPN